MYEHSVYTHVGKTQGNCITWIRSVRHFRTRSVWMAATCRCQHWLRNEKWEETQTLVVRAHACANDRQFRNDWIFQFYSGKITRKLSTGIGRNVVSGRKISLNCWKWEEKDKKRKIQTRFSDEFCACVCEIEQTRKSVVPLRIQTIDYLIP